MQERLADAHLARVDRWMTGLAACIGMTALYVGASSFMFTKRDL